MLQWQKITDHWQAHGRCGRWQIKETRHGMCRVTLNGGLVKGGDFHDIKTAEQGKMLAEELDAKQSEV